jgi:ABC-type nitrate/sulfonate/bicarbonate transport system substrate-binding protein
VGYTPLAVIEGLKLYNPTKLRLVKLGDTHNAKEMLRHGDIDIAMWPIHVHVLARSDRCPAMAILKADESREADGVVAIAEIKEFSDLANKTVARQSGEAGAYLMSALCEKHGFDIGRIHHFEAKSAKEAADLFIAGKVDACVTYASHLSDAKKERAGAHLLASAKCVPGTIVDVLVVREEYLNLYPENMRVFAEAWFKAVEILNDPNDDRHDEAIMFARKFNGRPGLAEWNTSEPCTEEKYREIANEDKLEFSGRQSNEAFFGTDGGHSLFHEKFDQFQGTMFPLPYGTTRPEEGDGSGVWMNPAYSPRRVAGGTGGLPARVFDRPGARVDQPPVPPDRRRRRLTSRCSGPRPRAPLAVLL